MRPTNRLATHIQLAALALALLAANTTAQAQDSNPKTQDPDPKAQARRALDTFFQAWNTADNTQLRKTINYPHLSLFGARMIVANEPKEFSINFDEMKTNEDWAKSTLDAITFGEVAPEKVNCTVTYSRVNTQGNPYRTGRVAYIVTKIDGHWGMQFRAPLRPEDPAAEAKARPVLEEFFDAFNAADNDRLRPISNYPHAFLVSNGRLSIAPTAQDLVMNFDGMRQREGWHKSTLDSAKLIHATKTQVHYDIVFSRQHKDGTTYRTIPARWILTNNNNHWGLQFRSLMPPTLPLEP